jgi:hypothetical protein
MEPQWMLQAHLAYATLAKLALTPRTMKRDV